MKRSWNGLVRKQQSGRALELAVRLRSLETATSLTRKSLACHAREERERSSLFASLRLRFANRIEKHRALARNGSRRKQKARFASRDSFSLREFFLLGLPAELSRSAPLRSIAAVDTNTSSSKYFSSSSSLYLYPWHPPGSTMTRRARLGRLSSSFSFAILCKSESLGERWKEEMEGGKDVR